MKKIIFLVLISFLFFNSIYSQVAINTDGSDPNNHAMLDVQSSTMGLLVPRMLTSERNTFESALGATEKGMLVYDTDLGSFYFFDGTNFVKIQQGVITNLEDADSDTKIEVERTADDDLIYFSLGGTDHFKMTGGRLEVLNTGKSVFLGEDAGLNDDISDNFNVFIGYNAGKSNISGMDNVAIGKSSLISNTYGHDNTAIGAQSMQYNETGDYNAAVGFYSLNELTEGNGNSACGAYAQRNNISGDYNTSIGDQSLYHNATGDSNTAVGFMAGFKSYYSGCVYLGFKAGWNNNSDNKLFIENSDSDSPLIYGEFDNDILAVNGNLGIATQTPAVKLHVTGGTDAGLTSGGYIVSGMTTGQNIVMDENEIMARDNGAINSLHLQRDGGAIGIHYNMVETSEFRIELDGKTGIGENAPNSKLHINTPAGENGFRVQINGATKFLVHSNGGVVAGHNVTTPTFAFQLANVDDDLFGKGRAFAWETYSDNRLKSNQRTVEYGLEELMQLQPKSYDHHSSSTTEEGDFIMVTNRKIATVGFIAQEVQQIIPEAVNEPADESKDLWSMDYDKLIPVLTKAIQEQQIIIDEMRLEIEVLKNKSE